MREKICAPCPHTPTRTNGERTESSSDIFSLGSRTQYRIPVEVLRFYGFFGYLSDEGDITGAAGEPTSVSGSAECDL